MEKIKQLLHLKNSDLAKLLHCNLWGLKASLEQGLKEYSGDPGLNISQDIITEIDQVLVSLESKVIESQQPEVIEHFSLDNLYQELISDKQLVSYLGRPPELDTSNDGQFWQEMQLLFLRLPENIAKSWQQKALAVVEKVGGKPQKMSPKGLPYPSKELIYYGLDLEKTNTKSRSLIFSEKAKLDERIESTQEDGELYLLACVVSSYITLIELDSNLHHAFKPVFRFGLRSLQDSTEKEKYIQGLIKCFHNCQTTRKSGNIIDYLHARINLDEAINSLVFDPPTAPDSWWGKLQQESRRTLNTVAEKAREENNHVVIRPLMGVYADIRKFSKDDIQLDRGGTPGEVLTCLRVYSKINQEEVEGRVLYRSFR